MRNKRAVHILIRVLDQTGEHGRIVSIGTGSSCDLHDGIGSITTNIAYLSAAAKANDDLSEVDRNLESIGDLAEQGLTEIRSYMHSLDSDHESWGALV
ncbi:MAG: histidine kinase, partial [Deltaproteobacteria bacterium]|nr:histidine kinase [Deltaproteobacteria bacterium]